MINWNSGGRFSFGNLDAAQQAQFESNPQLAYQMLLNWYGQGDPNFASTTLGRYIAAQESRLNNDYLAQAGQQQADFASQKAAWDAQQASNKATFDQQQQRNLADYNARLAAAKSSFDAIAARYNDPKLTYTGPDLKQQYQQAMASYNQLKNNPYAVQQYQAQDWTAPSPQLTWTKYLENSPAATGGLAQQFGFLTASQRGAQPGAFEVRRNLW